MGERIFNKDIFIPALHVEVELPDSCDVRIAFQPPGRFHTLESMGPKLKV